ncbi:outer membrane protein [Sphingomonas sp. LT1P40]|uniref:outer membrane protein n=1 Tax=Alteristakelama amylovorans TaxID=3096166 RepID=UPI002FC81AE8
MKKLLAAVAVLSCVPGIAVAQDEAAPPSDFAGLRAELRLGYETPTVSGDGDVYKIGSAVSYGGEIGYDLAVSDKVTFGPYINYEFSGVELCDGGDCLEIESNLSAGGRVGVALSPTAALYGKVGYASLKLKAASGGFTGTDNKGGVYGALGAEFAVSSNVYVNVEAAYADYGDFYGTGFNLQRRHVAAGVGFRF